MAKQGVRWAKVSGYLFQIGVFIAVVAGIVNQFTSIPSPSLTLVLLGAAIGLLSALKMGNITKRGSEFFLLAVIALIVAGSSGAVFEGVGTDFALGYIGAALSGIFGNIAILVAPAVVIIALETVWRVCSGKAL